jgi:hypothetical protein
VVGESEGSDMFTALVSMMLVGTSEKAKQLGIIINPHGLRMGWASWPINFDPIWIEHCGGFEKK